ncbi:MAG: hypothetical protein ACM34E_08840 [Acidobacteriota bacterium]
MKNTVTDRNLVRQYLLGRLDEQKELEDNLSERILFDDEMIETVDSVEDEIIEEYLDGLLDASDRNAVHQYFLQAPERKQKLRFATLLRHHFDSKPARPLDRIRDGFVRPPLAWLANFRTFGAAAALVLISIASLIYVTSVRRSQARVEAELDRERERSETLAQQAEVLQPPMVLLTLVANRSRAAGTRIPQVEIKSSTRRIIVDIALQGGALGPYDVRLETKGGKGPLWSARLLPLVAPTGDARLVFDVPARGIDSDIYSFVVSSSSTSTAAVRHYDFQAKLAK